MTVSPAQEERFWAKVQKTEGCWLWTSQIEAKGYGRFRFNGRPVLAHRFSYELAYGPIPSGMEIDHLCRTRHCIKPEHLEAISHIDNLRRGNTFDIGSVHRSITHCPRGHPYNAENTYHDKKGRQCIACRRERAKELRTLP